MKPQALASLHLFKTIGSSLMDGFAPFSNLNKKILNLACLHWTFATLAWLSGAIDGHASGKGVVAAGHPLAAEAGLAAFRKGGNAVDAAVATGLTLGVVDGFNSGIGGGCFLMIHTPQGEIIGLDGREMAPSEAHRDMYLLDGKVRRQASLTGALAVGVPGALAAFDVALDRYGRLSLQDLLLPAAEIAEKGFRVNQTFHSRVASVAKTLRDFPEIRQVYLNPSGNAHAVGDIFIQNDLARSYRNIAKEGLDYFYRGPIAVALSNWMNDNRGLVSMQDMDAYRPVFRAPVKMRYRGFEVAGFPPPSSGGVHVAQILSMLQHFDLGSMDRLSADWVHLVVEAMKLAFADRAHWLGDPDYTNVPSGLTDPDYGKKLSHLIQGKRAAEVSSHGIPPHAHKAWFGSHTTHYSTADAEGWWVACTATVNTTLGSKVMVPGTGIVLNNEMDDFSVEPGKPNYFGLLGSEANAVQSGKRPLSSMSPTIVSRNGEPFLSLGAAGGPTIISQTVVHLILMLDFGLSLDQALAHPRFHHQWKPDRIVIEKTWPDSVLKELRARGHTLSVVSSIGAAQAVTFSKKTKDFSGESDPRIDGAVASW
ncbi:MAG: gamma-glutamyltransferase [Verrucomicrobiota bacterium]|nr:gamma-glutamyltransferase [Verrucomicrobiota bacterium]